MVKSCFSTFSCYAKHTISLEEKPFYTYFTCSYYADKDDSDRPVFHVSAFTVHSHRKVFDCICDSSGNLSYYSSFGRDHQRDILSCIITFFIQNDRKAFREACDAYDQSTENIEKEEQTRDFNQSLLPVFREIDAEDISASLAKASLEVHLDDNLDSFVLTLYIGRKKFYKITNIDKFLMRFEKHDNYRYGKDFAFDHYLSSFDERSQRIIRILRGMKPLLSGIVKPDAVDEILDSLQEDDIYIGNIPYHIDKETIPAKIHVRKDFSMEVTGLPEEYRRLTTNYYVSEKVPVIRKLTDNGRINQLVCNVMEYPLATIEKKFDDFKYSFFLKYPTYFAFDEELNEMMGKSSLKLKTYFDYEDEAVSYNLKIFREGKKTEREEIENIHEVQFLTRYSDLLFSMGFNAEGKMTSQSDVWNFLYGSLENLKRYSDIYLSESLSGKKLEKFAPPAVSVTKSGNGSMLDVFMADSAYSKDELFAILDAIRKKKKFVLLKDRFISVADDDAGRFGQMAEDYGLLEQKKVNQSVRVPLYYAFKSFSSGDDSLQMDDYVTNVFEDLRNFGNSDVTLPEINGTLREYQKDGVRWLSVLYRYSLGGILADDMGLGKTIETIAFLKAVSPSAPCLIVCPKSLVFNWESEFHKFDPDTRVVPLLGTAEERKKIIDAIRPGEKAVYFISYDSLRNEIKSLENIHFDTCILDEAQFIKNVNAKKTNAVKSIHADHLFALTGTPIENNVVDLWSIFDFLMPHYFLELKQFKSSFESDENYTRIIRRKAAPFILRRNKKDVLKDLPEKYEVLYSVEMTAEQRKIYDAYRLKAKELITENGNGKIMQVLSYLTRLRQICVDPGLFIDDYKGGSGKSDALREIFRDKLNDGHRILLFSQFVTALNGVEEIMKEEKIPYRMITGETSAKERTEICSEFNGNEDIKAVLISLKAGGTGLNLTGADTVIHLDPWWNLAAQNQASDRAHRIGQTRNVEVIRMICENSVEQRVVQLQEAKKELVEKVISENDEEIRNLSVADLKEILSF